MKRLLPPMSLALLLLLSPILAACGGGGGSSASDVAQKTEVEQLIGTYLGIGFTILRADAGATSERDADSWSMGLALRQDGTYIRTIVVDGVETTDLGTWNAQYSVIQFQPGDDSCAYEASYRLQDGILITDALHPCDEEVRITRRWQKD